MRVQDAAGKYQLINPRAVKVKGETHFDLKGPKFFLMSKGEQFPAEKNTLYVRIEDSTLHYQVIALSGEQVNGSIAVANLQCPLVQLDNLDQLEPYIPAILKITSERDHTHPQALISAFETYVYELNRRWNHQQLAQRHEQLVQKWCGGVGMAEREVPVVYVHEMCREDVYYDGFDAVRGEFNEAQFPRLSKVNNWVTTDDWLTKNKELVSWFASGGEQTRLGLDFGILTVFFLGVEGEGACQGFEGGKDDLDLWVVRQNLADLSALCAVRAVDIAKLRSKLDPANHLDLAVAQGLRME